MFSEELGGNEPGKHSTEQSLSNSLSPNHVVSTDSMGKP